MRHPLRATVLGLVLGVVILYGPVTAGQEAKTRSPFAGNYSGLWKGTTTAGKQTGLMTLAVNADGTFTGTEKSETTSRTAKLTGRIGEDGEITVTIEYPGSISRSEGTVTRTKDGHLKGTLIQYLDKDQLFAGYHIELLRNK
jgi:hypothetical protein